MSVVPGHQWDGLARVMCGDDREWAAIACTAAGDRLRTYAQRAAIGLGCVDGSTLQQQYDAARLALRTAIRRGA